MGNAVSGNPLVTRADVERAAVQLIEPLIPLLSPGRARLHLGDTGAVYPASIAEMEAFARPMWAMVPMLAGSCESVLPLWREWREGIINGVNPAHPEYWGEVSDYDQRLVEMAVLGVGLCLAPDKFYRELPTEAQRNLYLWLDQINRCDMPKNNWTFFRVLVNLGFLTVGLPYPEERMALDLAMIEEHYEGDGWYFDYRDQREYYTFWAFHYYGLIYAHVMRDRDPVRSREYIQRGLKLAGDFNCWFDSACEAIPYGRSLTYRFAQGSFYAALALAAGEECDLGAAKRLLLGNMRRWFQKPIFTRDGVLTIGYGYPNLHMAEGYNAPGSPYWAMKAFLCLALPEDHPFWQAEEKAPDMPERSLQPHARMLVTRSADRSHVMAFQAGNHSEAHAHTEAKYEKFVYSTAFGFSVHKSMKFLASGAFDSMLALSEDGVTFMPRHGCESFELSEDRVSCVWKPMPGVTVATVILPAGEWHVRVHRIVSDRALTAAEGGYAIARDGEGTPAESADDTSACVVAPWGVSGIRAMRGYEKGQIVRPEPNTNLMAPRTLLPTLMAPIAPGETTLVCAVLGTATGGPALWAHIPEEVKRYAELA